MNIKNEITIIAEYIIALQKYTVIERWRWIPHHKLWKEFCARWEQR